MSISSPARFPAAKFARSRTGGGCPAVMDGLDPIRRRSAIAGAGDGSPLRLPRSRVVDQVVTVMPGVRGVSSRGFHRSDGVRGPEPPLLSRVTDANRKAGPSLLCGDVELDAVLVDCRHGADRDRHYLATEHVSLLEEQRL